MSTPPPNEPNKVDDLIEHLFRTEYGKVIAYLTSIFGVAKLSFIEDMAQETLLEAYKRWSYHGIPEEPAAWIFKVAKNKALNFIKREQKRDAVYDKHQERLEHDAEDQVFLEKEIEDSVLQMVFACASLDLSPTNKTMLILNILGGFNRKEIAHAFLMEEEAVKKRLFRAKKEIRDRDLKFVVPSDQDQRLALNAVLSSLYLLFNEGYNSASRDELIRHDICLEAIRLTKLVISHFEQSTEARALLSLMYFHTARFSSRIDDRGAIILLQDQNRASWDKELIALGQYYLGQASSGDLLSAYHIEAAIAGEHCRAENFNDTNWERISRLYNALTEFKKNPIIQLNLAIISSMLGDHQKAIDQLLELEKDKALRRYYLLYATKGELYQKLGQVALARQNFETAKTLTESKAELNLLEEKISQLI